MAAVTDSSAEEVTEEAESWGAATAKAARPRTARMLRNCILEEFARFVAAKVQELLLL